MKTQDKMLDLYKKNLRGKGLRFTKERKIILQETMRIKSHFDALMLYEWISKKNFGISLDTIYRTLPLMLESGLLQKAVGTGKQEYFEYVSANGHHDHMICISCQKIIEFHSRKLEQDQEEVCKTNNFTMLFHDHRIFGYCLQCSDK